MGKRQKKKKVSGQDLEDRKKKVLKDPDPNSEDYMYDEVDKFHLSKDKILLDPSEEKDDESELEENLDEEVLALEGVSSSDEDSNVDDEDHEEEIDEGNDEEMSSEDENDKSLLNDKAWGRNKKAFYDADVHDDDVYASDEEAENAALEEEKEAMILQKRLAQQLDAEDFYTFDEKEIEMTTEETPVVKDISKLTKREKLELIAVESPELLPLLDDYKEKFKELKDKYHPLLLMAKNGLIANTDGVKFIELKHQLLLNYLINISFYLVLKSSKENTKGHPVIDVLVQHQQMFSQIKAFDEKLEPEINEYLLKYKEHIKDGFASLKSDIIEEKVQLKAIHVSHEKSLLLQKTKKPKKEVTDLNIDPLEYYNLIKSQHEKVKIAKKQKLDIEDGIDNDIEDNEEEGKRMITYEMSKNKGLIRNRRKELKNPRVKHKMKFKKAVVKRKGQVREVQHEINRYGGETTGIKSSLTRSTKIK